MEIKIFCLFKDTVKNAKGKPSNWEKCLQHIQLEKRLSKIYKETRNPIRSEQTYKKVFSFITHQENKNQNCSLMNVV